MSNNIISNRPIVSSGLGSVFTGEADGRRKEFAVAVTPELKARLDDILKPQRLTNTEQTSGSVTLPSGYALLVKLYKDHDFMNTVRWQGDDAINGYLNERYPDIVSYLKVHAMRVTANIAGSDKNIAAVALESASSSSSAKADRSACVESRSTVAATTDRRADFHVETSVSARASVVARSEAIVCVNGGDKGNKGIDKGGKDKIGKGKAGKGKKIKDRFKKGRRRMW